MRDDIKKLNMYAANVFSSILAQNHNAISMVNRDWFISRSFEIAKHMMKLNEPQHGVDRDDHVSDEVAEAFAKKDALLKTLLAGIFGSDMDAVARSLHHDDSGLVDEAIAVVAGLRDDSKLLDEETSRANKLESELSGILHEFYDDREDISPKIKNAHEDNATPNNIDRAIAAGLVKRSIVDLGLDAINPCDWWGALTDIADAGQADAESKLDATIKKASEKGDHPTINGSEREWQEFVKHLVLGADKYYG